MRDLEPAPHAVHRQGGASRCRGPFRDRGPAGTFQVARDPIPRGGPALALGGDQHRRVRAEEELGSDHASRPMDARGHHRPPGDPVGRGADLDSGFGGRGRPRPGNRGRQRVRGGPRPGIPHGADSSAAPATGLPWPRRSRGIARQVPAVGGQSATHPLGIGARSGTGSKTMKWPHHGLGQERSAALDPLDLYARGMAIPLGERACPLPISGGRLTGGWLLAAGSARATDACT